MTNKRITGKKAQVGATLTWIAAFLIIFFIMLVFLAASVGAIKLRKLTTNDYRISTDETEEESLMQSRMLFSLLNNQIEIYDNGVNRDIAIKDALAYLDFDELKKDDAKLQMRNILKEIVKYVKPACYLFMISSGKKNIEFEDLAAASGVTFSYYLFSSKPDAYEKTDKAYIQNNKEGQIKTELFAGRC